MVNGRVYILFFSGYRVREISEEEIIYLDYRKLD